MRLAAIDRLARRGLAACPRAPSPQETDRYTLEKSDNGYVRMDTADRRDVDLRGALRPARLQDCGR